MKFNVILPEQADGVPVFSFVATAQEISAFARIDRAARTTNGTLRGFQRPQILNHIREIKAYLASDRALLPNPIVIAFTEGVTINRNGNGTGTIDIDVSGDPKGWIVDGQQRFTALSELQDKHFEIFVSGFVCDTEEELHKQFILINNTRPLPKSLIYELLPRVKDLPDRLKSRSTAASLVELLNYSEESCLKGMIKQQTNPAGVIVDTSIQKVIMNSLSDGILRMFYTADDFEEKAFMLLNNYFGAVAEVFADAWHGQKPTTSRLVHGAGVVAMGYLMEAICVINGTSTKEAFAEGLALIKGRTAWIDGQWDFGEDDVRKWDSIQNVARDTRQLSQYLVGEYKRVVRQQRRCA